MTTCTRGEVPSWHCRLSSLHGVWAQTAELGKGCAWPKPVELLNVLHVGSTYSCTWIFVLVSPSCGRNEFFMKKSKAEVPADQWDASWETIIWVTIVQKVCQLSSVGKSALACSKLFCHQDLHSSRCRDETSASDAACGKCTNHYLHSHVSTEPRHDRNTNTNLWFAVAVGRSSALCQKLSRATSLLRILFTQTFESLVSRRNQTCGERSVETAKSVRKQKRQKTLNAQCRIGNRSLFRKADSSVTRTEDVNFEEVCSHTAVVGLRSCREVDRNKKYAALKEEDMRSRMLEISASTRSSRAFSLWSTLKKVGK